MRKIDVPTGKPTEFELGDTAADIQRRREERGGEGGGRERTERGEGGSQEGVKSTVKHRGGSGRKQTKN